jgi:TPR repeat protein
MGLEFCDFALYDYTPKDDEKARKWFERGVGLGDPECMFYLSTFVFDGRGGDSDPERATLLLLQAASAKCQLAAHRALKLEKKGALTLAEEDRENYYALDRQLYRNVMAR